jgi:hypothetical protein
MALPSVAYGLIGKRGRRRRCDEPQHEGLMTQRQAHLSILKAAERITPSNLQRRDWSALTSQRGRRGRFLQLSHSRRHLPRAVAGSKSVTSTPPERERIGLQNLPPPGHHDSEDMDKLAEPILQGFLWLTHPNSTNRCNVERLSNSCWNQHLTAVLAALRAAPHSGQTPETLAVRS